MAPEAGVRRPIVLGSLGVLLALSAALAARAITARGVNDKGSIAARAPRFPTIQQAAYARYSDLARLTRFAPVVARVRYVQDLGSYRLALDPPIVNGGPPASPVPSSIGAWKSQPSPVSQPAPIGAQLTDQGPVKTDMLVRVVGTIKGNGVANGDQIVITLDGGQSCTVGPAEGDPLPRPGQEEIVFLWPNSLDASKYATGGPDMRFAVTGTGTVKAVVPGPIAREYDGSTVSAFMGAVRALMPSPTR